MRYRRITTLALGLAFLCACQQAEKELPGPRLPAAAPSSVATNRAGGPETQAPAQGTTQGDPLAFSSEKEYVQFLAGTWEYGRAGWMVGGNERGTLLTFSADGSYHMELTTWDNAKNAEVTYTYEGPFGIYRMEAGDDELPDTLRLALEKTDDPYFTGWSSIGDFTLAQRSLCDGNSMLMLEMSPDSETVFSRHYGDEWSILSKPASAKAQGAVIRGENFLAVAWKCEVEGDKAAYWLDDLEGGSFANRGRYESVRYETSPGLITEDMLDFYIPAGTYCEVETDKSGQIIYLHPLRGRSPEGEPQPAVLTMPVLLGQDEVNAYLASGMIVMTEEPEIIAGESCDVYSLGTDHENNFVREVYYAVSPAGTVYKMDPITGAWELLGKG